MTYKLHGRRIEDWANTPAPLFDFVEAQRKQTKDFPGATFDRGRDGARLAAQEQRVASIMQDGAWRGLRDIAILTGDPEASVSARLRGLRHDGHAVERKFVTRGLWHYRLRVLG